MRPFRSSFVLALIISFTSGCALFGIAGPAESALTTAEVELCLGQKPATYRELHARARGEGDLPEVPDAPIRPFPNGEAARAWADKKGLNVNWKEAEAFAQTRDVYCLQSEGDLRGFDEFPTMRIWYFFCDEGGVILGWANQSVNPSSEPISE